MMGRAISIAGLMGLAGCGVSVEYTPTNHPKASMAPRVAADVEVFTGAKPERPFQDVALIEVRQESTASTAGQSEMLREMRAMAARRGCHGLLVQGAADLIVGRGDSVGTLRGLRASCIVFTDGSAAQPAPPALAGQLR